MNRIFFTIALLALSCVVSAQSDRVKTVDVPGVDSSFVRNDSVFIAYSGTEYYVGNNQVTFFYETGNNTDYSLPIDTLKKYDRVYIYTSLTTTSTLVTLPDLTGTDLSGKDIRIRYSSSSNGIVSVTSGSNIFRYNCSGYGISEGPIDDTLATNIKDLVTYSIVNTSYVRHCSPVQGGGSSISADTATILVYAPSHGLTDSITTYGYVPIKQDYTKANSFSVDSIHFAYAVGAPSVDTLEIKLSGAITVTGHGKTLNNLYYLNDDGTESLAQGTVRVPTVYVLDANTLLLTEVGGSESYLIEAKEYADSLFLEAQNELGDTSLAIRGDMDRDTVYSITNVSDTISLSPQIGYIFINSTADTMGFYGESGWMLFFGGVSVDGSGTTNTVVKFTGATALGDSQITDDGIHIGINDAAPSYILDIESTNAAKLPGGTTLELIDPTEAGLFRFNTNRKVFQFSPEPYKWVDDLHVSSFSTEGNNLTLLFNSNLPIDSTDVLFAADGVNSSGNFVNGDFRSSNPAIDFYRTALKSVEDETTYYSEGGQTVTGSGSNDWNDEYVLRDNIKRIYARHNSATGFWAYGLVTTTDIDSVFTGITDGYERGNNTLYIWEDSVRTEITGVIDAKYGTTLGCSACRLVMERLPGENLGEERLIMYAFYTDPVDTLMLSDRILTTTSYTRHYTLKQYVRTVTYGGIEKAYKSLVIPLALLSSDNQTVDSFFLSGNILTLALQGDNEDPYTVDLSSLSGGASSGSVTATISQTAHGFSLGDPIYYTGSTWALATTTDSTRAIALVSDSTSANVFEAHFAGPMAWASHGYTLGETQYLAPSGTYQPYDSLINDEVAQELFTPYDVDTVAVNIKLSYVFNPVLVDVYDSGSGNEEIRATDNLIFDNSTVARVGSDVTISVLGTGGGFGAVSPGATDTVITVSLADTSTWRYDLTSAPAYVQFNFTGQEAGKHYTLHWVDGGKIFFDNKTKCYTTQYLDSIEVADNVIQFYCDAAGNMNEISSYPSSPGCSLDFVDIPSTSYAFDSVYQMILTLAGDSSWAIPTGADIYWQDTLMIELRAAGLLDSLDGLYIFAGNGDEDFKSINWVRTVDDAQKDRGEYVATYSVDSTGITGGTGYFQTNIPSMSHVSSRNDIMLGGWLYNSIASTYVWGDEYNRLRTHDVMYLSRNGFVDPTESDNSATGFHAGVRYGSTEVYTYANGTLGGALASVSNNGPSYDIYVVAANRTSGFNASGSSVTVSIFVCGRAISEAGLDSMYAAFQKYMAHY